MPTFKIAGQPATVWIPLGRVTYMESAPGGLTTVVKAVLATEQGEKLGTLEVEGRCEMLGAAIDAGKPTETGH